MEAAKGLRALGASIPEGEDLHRLRFFVEIHLTTEGGDLALLGDLIDLRVPILNQDGTKGKEGRVEFGAVSNNEFLELTAALGRAGVEPGAGQQFAGVVPEGVLLGLAADGQHMQVLKEVGHLLIGPLGPFSSANYEWGGCSPSPVAQACTISCRSATTSGTLAGPSIMRCSWPAAASTWSPL